MSQPSSQELAMKLVDVDETQPDRSLEESQPSPGLRPEVLADAGQRHMKAMVHAALFKGTGEAPTIGAYQVLKRLGEGGMGVVYAAYDDKLERKVALKLIRGAAMRRPEARARTLREARALARLSHPNVVHVYQVGEVEDEIFVAMEFLTGPTLRAWLKAKPRTWREVLAVFRQAGEGLAAAHRQGVIHRDFKPANVIVGDDGRVRVLDFGLAHFGDGGEAMPALPAGGEVTDVLLTQTGAVLGTPAYMAPEQFAGGRGDAKTDQFSFCAALYEALYGQRPFAGDKLEALVAAVASGRVQGPKPGSEVPGWLQRVVLRGLSVEPAARWPGMDALLAALSPPERRLRRIVATVGSSLGLLMGGGMLLRTAAPDPAAIREEVTAARAETTLAHDETLLTAARAALTRDPVETIRALAQLAGDEPATWQEARFLAEAAVARGLPAAVLRAGDRELAEVWPLAGGGFVGSDVLGAVWQWKMSERTGVQVLPPGAATQLLVARDAPVWAVTRGRTVEVFGAGRAQTIEVGAIEPSSYEWRLASDGRTLVASTRSAREGIGEAVYLWDLTRPGSPPQTVPQVVDVEPVWLQVADDASVVVRREAKGLRVVRPRLGTDTLLPYPGRPWAVSGDGQFVVAHPTDKDGVIDVVDLATGAARQVEAGSVVMLAGSDVLFAQPMYAGTNVRRESLATGGVAWRLQLPGQSAFRRDWLVADPAGERFAVRIDDAWGIGELRRGTLTSFMTVPKDMSPRWVGDGSLMVTVRDEVRVHRPDGAPVQVRASGYGCAMAPGGRWAVVEPWNVANGEFTRVELATGVMERFRCPTEPEAARFGPYERWFGPLSIDDAGQVTALGEAGRNCWWDEQHGARTSTKAPASGWSVGLARGTAVVREREVEVWTGPDEPGPRFTIAGPAADVEASPSGALLAVRSDRGVQVLEVASGATKDVVRLATPQEKAGLNAGALAWSPDSTRLALLDRVDGSLELSVWDVAGAPLEIERHVLKDSPGRPRNWVTFTPAGTAVALTDRHKSVMLVTLGGGETRRLAVPDLFALHMRSETDAIGIDIEYGTIMADFATGSVTPLTPNPRFGGSTRPPIRRSANGSVWTCAALGPGTLLEVAAMDEARAPEDVRRRIHALAAALSR